MYIKYFNIKFKGKEIGKAKMLEKKDKIADQKPKNIDKGTKGKTKIFEKKE